MHLLYRKVLRVSLKLNWFTMALWERAKPTPSFQSSKTVKYFLCSILKSSHFLAHSFWKKTTPTTPTDIYRIHLYIEYLPFRCRPLLIFAKLKTCDQKYHYGPNLANFGSFGFEVLDKLSK